MGNLGQAGPPPLPPPPLRINHSPIDAPGPPPTPRQRPGERVPETRRGLAFKAGHGNEEQMQLLLDMEA